MEEDETVDIPTHCSCCVQRKSDPPSLSHYRSITPEKANHIARIDDDVLRTHDAIAMLLNQRAALNRQRNAFVPAINLPPEILTTIFEFAFCPDDDWILNLDLDAYGQTPVVTPLFIGSICSAWRSVAWGAPQLWNNIALIHHDAIDEKLAEMLEYWLSKSGELPLTVKLTESCDVIVLGESFAVIDVIEDYADRLHTLDLFLPSAWESNLQYIACCAPMLTRLTLRVMENSWKSDRCEVDEIFEDAKQLREVTLHGYNTLNASFPWDQLESLESEYDDISNLLTDLDLCPRLRRFAVRLTNRTPSIPASDTGPGKHATLEALEVLGYNETLHSGLLEKLDLPALRSFVLQLQRTPRAWTSWLPPFLSQVAGTLETLHLPYAGLSDEDLLTILRIVPRLRELVLLHQSESRFHPSGSTNGEKNRLTQRVLDLMNPTKYEGLERDGTGQLDSAGNGVGVGATWPEKKGGGHCLVPNLETFQFTGRAAFISHALVEFLVARWRGRSTPRCGTSDAALDSPDRKLEGPRTQATCKPLPPNLNASSTRLRSATFRFIYRDFKLEDADAAVVQELRQEGMDVKIEIR